MTRPNTKIALSVSSRNIRPNREALISHDFEDHDYPVIFVGTAAGEEVHFLQHDIDDLLSGLGAFAHAQIDEARLAEFLGLLVHGFGDAIRARYDDIARIQPDVAAIIMHAGK